MPRLSHAARTVLGAYLRTPANMRSTVVAVIRALADEVVPEEPHEDTFEYCCDYSQSWQKSNIRSKLIAIANEIENHDV